MDEIAIRIEARELNIDEKHMAAVKVERLQQSIPSSGLATTQKIINRSTSLTWAIYSSTLTIQQEITSFLLNAKALES